MLATRQDVDAFGPLLATAAWSMGLFTAPRRALVADGSSENWTVYKRYFSRWTAVKEGSPRRVVEETLTHLTNQQDKMHYDVYRPAGFYR